jgi:phage terminase large subunit
MEPATQTEIYIPPEFKELFNPKWRNLVYYGGRGSTKSHSIARSLIIRGRESRLRFLCAREVQNSIEESSFQLLKDIIDHYGLVDYRYISNEIVNVVTGSEFIFKGLRKGSTQSVKSLEGIDVAWVEEAQTVTEESLDILSPTIRREGSQLIFSFNRLTELDPVYVKYVQNPPPNTYSRMVNYNDIEQYGIFPTVLRDEMEHDKATNPDLYAHKWLGEPISQGEFAIISRSGTIGAMEREIEPDGAIIIGADIARMGSDRTVLWKRKGLKTVDTKVFMKLRTTEVCDQLELFAENDKTVEVKIDDTGVGGGVTDEMIKRGYNVIPINFGAEAGDKNKYPNWISEAWFHMAEVMNDADLPYDADLLMELSTRQWAQDNKGKRRVESKADYKKRGFRSPDLADACIICYSVPVVVGLLAYYKDRAADQAEQKQL